MTSRGHYLYPMDSNHQELDRVSHGGQISRLKDISAVFPDCGQGQIDRITIH